jgi:ubiquinone/menaquinone biosynthesis C-methylase UbiE
MLPKPKHWSDDYGAWFKDPGIVAAYHRRPPYPAEVFELLAALAVDEPRAVLDVGAGTGDVARGLVPLVERVDAVDFSLGMIEKGQRQPGGDHSNLRWIHGAVEDAPIDPPYALITAGESLHWMAWEVVLPRFARVLTANGVLAMVERSWNIAGNGALGERMRPLYMRYSASRDFQSVGLSGELQTRGLFRQIGSRRTDPQPWRPTLDEYVELHHSQRSFSPDRMGPEAVAAFDVAVRAAALDLVREGTIQLRDGRLDLAVWADVIWGKPLDPWS